MDLVQSSEHLCYVRCNFCGTVLAVGIPRKRLSETVTVKCGHCSNLSFLSNKPPFQGQCYDHQTSLHQAVCSEFKKGHSSSSTSSTSTEPSSPKAPFVVKPPEKKHRLPSAYNRFMKEEIQRIKAANPEIPHREAFSAAAKIGLGTSQPLLKGLFPTAPKLLNSECLLPRNVAGFEGDSDKRDLAVVNQLFSLSYIICLL